MTIQDWLGENNQLGIDIWNKKYKYENETFDEWLQRVSNGDKEVAKLIKEKKFLFGGRILANRGLHKLGKKVTYSNCYVISAPEDNLESIYETAAKLARTYSYGGGCGVDISKLAPRGAKVNNTAKETSGAVSFMDTYSQVTGQIGQNGRRGALMISIDCNHPDLEEFLDIKTDVDRVTKANISVRITDQFMEAVINDDDYELHFERPETGECIKKTIKAKQLFMKLVKNNWNYAEPGCLFWDRISTYNLLQNTSSFSYAGTNPCAEEPLPAGGSCLLGSLNLAEFVKDDRFDFDSFTDAVRVAVIALNDVLEEGLPLHPLEEQRKSVAKWRQIGLGILGLADMLIKLKIRYGSKEALELCDEIGRIMAETAIKTSADMAEYLGAFPECNAQEITSTNFFEQNVKNTSCKDKVLQYGLRNSQLLTIAPTGTLSTMIGVSGGIEPIFANSYTRKTQSLHGKDVYYKVYTPIVEQHMKENNITEEEELPDYFITAGTLNYQERIKMQATWQKHIDASISSTVNVPNSFTVDNVYDLYTRAWLEGLKGVTIYRDGCARSAVLSSAEITEQIEENCPKRGEVIEASDNLIGLKRKLMTGCGSLHCTAFFDPETKELREVFLSKGSAGGCNNFMVGLSRMISMAARGGISVDDIVDQLMSTGSCPSYASRSATKHDTSKGSCCPMAVGYALKEMQQSFKGISATEIVDNTNPKCPVCGNCLFNEGGCNICKSCGYSTCSG